MRVRLDRVRRDVGPTFLSLHLKLRLSTRSRETTKTMPFHVERRMIGRYRTRVGGRETSAVQFSPYLTPRPSSQLLRLRLEVDREGLWRSGDGLH